MQCDHGLRAVVQPLLCAHPSLAFCSDDSEAFSTTTTAFSTHDLLLVRALSLTHTHIACAHAHMHAHSLSTSLLAPRAKQFFNANVRVRVHTTRCLSTVLDTNFALCPLHAGMLKLFDLVHHRHVNDAELYGGKYVERADGVRAALLKAGKAGD